MAFPRLAAVVAIFLGFLGVQSADAKYALVEIKQVPVERLIKNLEEAVRKDSSNPQAILNLARAHAMAYSLRSQEITVVAKSPDEVWFGYEYPFVPFREVAPTDDPEKLKIAKAHLTAALGLYADVVKLAPNDLIALLGQGWLLSQTEKKHDAIPVLRKVIEKSLAGKPAKEPELGRGESLAVEAGSYLIPLLDPEKDKAEIATLRAREEEDKKRPRVVTPIVVPLAPGLAAADLEDRSGRVTFDVDGTGLRKEWSWITRDAAWLVHDPAATGKITSGLQLFGSVTFWLFWETGYGALSALDDNHDGELAGSELQGLALWRDTNGNGVSDPGEVRPLSEYGIVAISCRSQIDAAHPDRISYSPAGVRFKDGTTRATYDLLLRSR